jgi:hypothetical protein
VTNGVAASKMVIKIFFTECLPNENSPATRAYTNAAKCLGRIDVNCAEKLTYVAVALLASRDGRADDRRIPPSAFIAND